MSCGSCGGGRLVEVAVQVPLFGGTGDLAWTVRPKGDTYTVQQGTVSQVPAASALRYLKQQAEPFNVRGCKSWMLTAVQVAPSTTDLVSAHVARYLAIGGLGDSEGGWGTFGPLGSVGGALADAGEAAASGTLTPTPAANTLVVAEDPIQFSGTIGVDTVDVTGAFSGGGFYEVPPFDISLDVATVFRNVVALPAICCPRFPLPVDAGWTLALRLAGDAGLGALVGRDVVLTLAGVAPGSCACNCKPGVKPPQEDSHG